MRCDYCMNSELLMRDRPSLSFEEIAEKLNGEDEWVCISGGEPTVEDKLLLCNLIDFLKDRGYKIAMTTNGCKPIKLRDFLPLLDYVALDFKTCDSEIYNKIVGTNDAMTKVIWTKAMLAGRKQEHPDFNYEIRTTLYPKYVTKKDISKIAGLMGPLDTWYLQQFRKTPLMLNDECFEIDPYNDKEIEEMLKLANDCKCNVYLRSV